MARLHIFAVALLAFVALATGCRETLNVGTVALPTWDNAGNSFTVSVNVPGNARSGQPGTFTTTITGGTAPYEVSYAFDSCVTPRTTTHSSVAGTTDTLAVTFDTVSADTTCTLTVTVKDANNRQGTRTRTFTLRAVAADTAPTIASATFDAATCTVTVTASDAEGDPVTIGAVAPTGLSVDAASKPLGAGGTVTFTFSATDPTAGGSGNASFTATANGLTSAATTTAVNCAALTLAADTLYAIPLQTTVHVGDPVTILVLTGDPANPFQYMAGVRVIAPDTSGFAYVANSFNVGAVGGAAGDVDGLWTAMSPSGFLLPPDNFIQATNTNNQIAIDFNVTPLGGSDLATATGALFNFQATFSAAGTYQLGFMQHDLVDNTYYQDSNLGPNFFWGDITNLHNGVNSSVTVLP